MRDAERAGRGGTTPEDALQGAGPHLGGLPGELGARASRAPDAPFLFFPDGLDVRWRSYATVASQVAAGAAALRATGLAPRSRVGFTWRCDPDALAADLAIQAAGLVAVPGSADDLEGIARLLLPGEDEAEGSVRLPRTGAASGGGALVGPLRAAAAAGGALVATAGGATADQELSATAQLAAAAGLAARLADAVTPPPPREIALACLDLSAPDGRAFAAWALVAGAALFLEPDPRALPGSTVWARPSVVAAELPALRELERLAREGETRGRHARTAGSRQPFGRLRALVLLGSGRMSADELGFWLERRVAVVRGG